MKHFNMRNWHHNITNRNKIANPQGFLVGGGRCLPFYYIQDVFKLKPIVNWAISMKIARADSYRYSVLQSDLISES